jgi:hypothetical protein
MSIKSSIKKLLLQDEEKEDPFEHIEYKTEEDEKPELNQPPTTRRELWSYYLYYNGVKYIFTYCIQIWK